MRFQSIFCVNCENLPNLAFMSTLSAALRPGLRPRLPPSRRYVPSYKQNNFVFSILTNIFYLFSMLGGLS